MSKLIGLYADSTAFAAYLIDESINGEIHIKKEVFSTDSSYQNICEKIEEFREETNKIKCNPLPSLIQNLRRNRWKITPINLDIIDSECDLNSKGKSGRIKCCEEFRDRLMGVIDGYDSSVINHKILAIFNGLYLIDKPKSTVLFSVSNSVRGDFGRLADN